MMNERQLPDIYMLRGSPSHCATCSRDLPTVAVAADLKHPKSGRWYVCTKCRDDGVMHKSGLTYYPDAEASRAALDEPFRLLAKRNKDEARG